MNLWKEKLIDQGVRPLPGRDSPEREKRDIPGPWLERPIHLNMLHMDLWKAAYDKRCKWILGICNRIWQKQYLISFLSCLCFFPKYSMNNPNPEFVKDEIDWKFSYLFFNISIFIWQKLNENILETACGICRNFVWIFKQLHMGLSETACKLSKTECGFVWICRGINQKNV